MKKILLLSLSLSYFTLNSFGQCTTTDATSCECEDQSANCDLLPDVTISWYALENYLSGPTENPGRIYVSGSTPNIGHGSFTARGVDDNGYRWFVCGVDTFSVYDPNAQQSFYCPNGGTARQIIFQRIYHKNGTNMSYWDRMMPASMTYHPTHGHNHFDEWGKFSLRMQDVNESDPRKWDIVAMGHKLGFCLMDYGTCSYYNGHCRDDNTVYNAGTTLTNSDFPNYGLGGGSYGCNMVEQGISSGYTDIYSENLDGMWIDIPPGTCNGDYWIVYEVDPYDVVLEENETNNYTAIPFTLTQQASSSAVAKISGDEVICAGDSVLLTATAGTSYLWSNGASTQSIWATAGTYDVTVTSYCGSASSLAHTVTEIPIPSDPVVTNDTVCIGYTATLTATGNSVYWYDQNGIEVGTGNTFVTPAITTTQTYYAYDESTVPGTISSVGMPDNTAGGGGNYTGDQGLIFDVYEQMTLKTVKVYAQGAGIRTFELYNAVGMSIQSTVINLQDGEQVVSLNWDIAPGLDYEITIGGTPDLYRNNTGVSYPYTAGSTMSITGSTAGASYYYFFYDWQIEVGGGKCGSNMVTAYAVADICSGVEDYDLSENINLYPNPSNGNFNIFVQLPSKANVEVRITDIAGRIIYNKAYANVEKELVNEIDLENPNAGLYFVTVKIGKKSYYRKMVIN